jgi:hypothetical protein
MLTSRRNSYEAYGLNIRSTQACPELLPNAGARSAPDVTIQWAPGCIDPLLSGKFEVRPDRFRLDVKGVARYAVESGRSIHIDALPESPIEKVRLFLMGSAMGALLYQRGLFPLHGSAVETPWGAMIFVGEQGAGKSTLAAEFYRRGYRLLSDDVCAVDSGQGGLRVLPALPHLRLCADAYERMGCPGGARFDVDKFIVPLGERYCPEPKPLRAIHVLSEHALERPRFARMRGLDRVRSLLANLYRPEYLKGQRTERDVLRMAGTIAAQAAVAAVSRKKDAGAAGDLVSFLESAWAAEFSACPSEEKCRANILC